MREPADPGESDDVRNEATTEEAMRLRRRPDNELPGTVAVDAVLASSEDLVVFKQRAERLPQSDQSGGR